MTEKMYVVHVFCHAFFAHAEWEDEGGEMTMKLIKALNNNVALVLDDRKRESVVMGRGVAFNIKPGGSVNPSLIEKHFVLDGKGGKKDFDSLLKRITVEDIELASGIIRRGEERLGYRCNDRIRCPSPPERCANDTVSSMWIRWMTEAARMSGSARTVFTGIGM